MKSAPYPGPEPTIAQLQAQFGWVWAYCGLACSHSAAIPLDAIAMRLGALSSARALRGRLRCLICGKRGAEIRAPSVVAHGLAPLPVELVPLALRTSRCPVH